MLNPKENKEESKHSDNLDTGRPISADNEERVSARRIIVGDKTGAIGKSGGNKSALKKIAIIVAVILLAVGAAMLIKAFVISPMQVTGTSMQPYLQEGDVIMVLKCGYKLDYGDVVVFDRTDEWTGEEKHPVKRIIGMAGDVLEFKDGNIYRNGELLDESAYHIESGSTPSASQTVHVPENSLFVCGDHRSVSKDSREYGAISRNKLIGKVIAVY